MTTARPAGTTVRRVIFVCHANIVRSPYAEHMARHLAGGTPLVFESAGFPGTSDQPMYPFMIEELRRRGVDGSAHRSRPLTPRLVTSGDLVLTMQFAQAVRLREQWPGMPGRILGLQQFARAVDQGIPAGTDPVEAAAGLPNSMAWDVTDPHGRGQDAAVECAAYLDDVLCRILPALTGCSVQRPQPGPPQPVPEPRPGRGGWRAWLRRAR